ncbi:MAG TPA: hypothetical protein VMW46_00640 [Candidatus Desulfaltia sp.]|nr:hypothetical protein [Candidatus Desulfaltia sp.]
MRIKKSRLSSTHVLLFLVLCILVSCTIKSPVLMYKDQRVDDPDKIPLRAGLKIVSLQGFQGVDIKSSQATLMIPLITYKGEFPKGKESEFLSDMVRQYFFDTSMFDYIYNSPFRNQDVDIILYLKLNRFILRNNKGWVTFRNVLNLIGTAAPLVLPFVLQRSSNDLTSKSSPPSTSTIGLASAGLLVIQLLPLVLPQEKFYTEYDIELELFLPNGEKIISFKKLGSGKELVRIFGKPFGEYLYHKSIFRKVFLSIMDEIRGEIKKNRDLIIAKHKEWLIS